MAYKYKNIIAAGTFDVLHEGHKNFLRKAFSLANMVYITITSDAYTSINKPHAASFLERKSAIQVFLQQEHLLSRAKIIAIDDVYGITTDPLLPIDALLVTTDSKAGAVQVNEKRKALHMSPLTIEEVSFLNAKVGIPLSSTSIRGGVFDKKGNLTIAAEITKAVSYMPEVIRQQLQKPFGIIVPPDELPTILTEKYIIAVGDVTVRTLHEKNIQPAIGIIDFVIERKKQTTSLAALGFSGKEKTYEATNPPATITPDTWKALSQALEVIDKKVVIVITGEEDLAVLPSLLLSPIGSVVCYGQPGVGMVMVPVTQDTKKQALHLLAAFTQR